MSIDQLIQQITQGNRVTFAQTQAVIDENYHYRPVKFINGTGNKQVINKPGTNEGSCKIFAFAKLQGLSESLTLMLFGDFYWKDVLTNPDGNNHMNIRMFMKTGWSGIQFVEEALTPAHSQ